jgi:DNA-directed RNA polymerase I subunit RPA49
VKFAAQASSIFDISAWSPANMAEKEGKKRKRQSQGRDAPSKKVAVEGAKDGANIKVTFADADGLQPVLVATPGLTAPQIPFKAYSKALSSKNSSAATKPRTHDMLLESSRHPRLDYTATASHIDNQNLAHYIAVFDPKTSELQVRPAHHLSLRANPRLEGAASEKKARSFAQQKEELGKAFGTRKAKKVIASRTENAIVKDGNKGKGKKDDVQDAILDTMAETTADQPGKEQMEADMLASKPIPKPNLAAENVEDVYTFNTLILPHEARLVPVKDWQDKVRADEALEFTHRFPASRVAALAKGGDIQRLKALRYLTLLLEFYSALANAGKAGKKVPKKEILSKRLGHWPEALVDSVRRRFANQNNELPKWHLDNLCTHICALSLLVDGWSTSTADLKDDLRLENKVIGQYFAELGCRLGSPTEKERAVWGLNKAVAATVKVARLKLPLEFPKVRAGRRR